MKINNLKFYDARGYTGPAENIKLPKYLLKLHETAPTSIRDEMIQCTDLDFSFTYR